MLRLFTKFGQNRSMFDRHQWAWRAGALAPTGLIASHGQGPADIERDEDDDLEDRHDEADDPEAARRPGAGPPVLGQACPPGRCRAEGRRQYQS